jgi:hypothetical protein
MMKPEIWPPTKVPFKAFFAPPLDVVVNEENLRHFWIVPSENLRVPRVQVRIGGKQAPQYVR